jgi:cytochrome c oxidase assembly factor CtaG
MSRRLVALAAFSILGVVLAFFVASAVPSQSAPGLPDAGIVVEWLVAFLRGASDLLAGLALGLLIYVVFVMTDDGGSLTEVARRRIRWVRRGLILWAFLVVVRIVIGLAEELGVSLAEAFDSTYIRSYLTQTSVGRYLVAQLIFLGIAVSLTTGIARWSRAFFTLLAVAFGAMMPVLTGHAAGSGNHSLALGSIALHVWAVSAWLGVLIGLWLDRSRHHVVSARASRIALIAAITVVTSGVVNGAVRLSSLSDLGSGYGRVLLLKTALFLVIVFLGARIRRSGLAIGAMRRVVAVESILMVFTIGVGAALSRIQTPRPRDLVGQSAAEELTGSAMLAEPIASRVLTSFSFDGFTLALIVALTLSYLLGVKTLRDRGDAWPLSRTVLFLLGMLVLFSATNGGFAAYAKFAFSWHMVAHMMIVTVAPIGIVLGAPITLALRTLPQSRDGIERGLRGHLQAALNTRTLSLLSHPVLVLIVFDASLFALYFTDAFANLMRWHLGHTLMDLHFLAVGLLFFYVIVGVDPNPRRTPHLVRIVLLLVAMSVHAFFSVALISMETLIDGGYFAELQRPWSTDLLADQQSGASLGWALGEVPIVLALIATFIQWVRADNREARRIDRAADRAEAAGEEDELAKYNAYLQRLADQSQKDLER